jgi:hypothetical protein
VWHALSGWICQVAVTYDDLHARGEYQAQLQIITGGLLRGNFTVFSPCVGKRCFFKAFGMSRSPSLSFFLSCTVTPPPPPPRPSPVQPDSFDMGEFVNMHGEEPGGKEHWPQNWVILIGDSEISTKAYQFHLQMMRNLWF